MRQHSTSTGWSGRFDVGRAIDRLDALVPEAPAWAFALRIWVAMTLALGMAFWFQLDGASSAATSVGILAQLRRGHALSKAFHRLLGTVAGAAVAIVLVALFGQDRIALLAAFTAWLGLCVFAAQYLQDDRAYGAALAGYTVAIIALAQIDDPQSTFTSAVNRVTAIAFGVVAVTVVNDALVSPSASSYLLPALAKAWYATRAFAHETLDRGDLGATRMAALIRTVAVLRTDANAVSGECDDGLNRAAGARSCIAALYAMAASIRAAAVAARGLSTPSPAVAEALAICRRVAGALDGDLDRDDERLRDLVDAAVRDGTRPLDEVVALQRALDFTCAATFARDGLCALADGRAPLRDARLPMHRDFAVALRAASRVMVAFTLTAAGFVALGLPQASFGLTQFAAFAARSTLAPDPKRYADGVLVGMVFAAVLAGVDRFVLLDGVQGFPMLALAMAPPTFLGCLLSLRPRTFGIGSTLTVFFPVLLAPANPQGYDVQAFLLNVLLVMVAAAILGTVVRVVLPLVPARRRAFALRSARRSLADALAGRGGNATTRTSLAANRLLQFADYSSGCGAVRRASLSHAFALVRLEAAAARAHADLRRLAAIGALRDPIRRARAALASGDDRMMISAAAALVGSAPDEHRTVRLVVARAASDLTAAARTIDRHRRFLRRLDVAPF